MFGLFRKKKKINEDVSTPISDPSKAEDKIVNPVTATQTSNASSAPLKSKQVEDQGDDVPDLEKEVLEAKTRPAPYHISLNKENGKWRVRKAGSAKVIKYFDTQKEAIDFAQERAKNNDNTIVIHKKDGKIRKQKYD